MARPNPEKTKAGNLKGASAKLICQWIKDAWDDLPKDLIIKSFLKAGISNQLDGTEDDWIFDHVDADSGTELDENTDDTHDDGDTPIVLRSVIGRARWLRVCCSFAHSFHCIICWHSQDQDSDCSSDDDWDGDDDRKSAMFVFVQS